MKADLTYIDTIATTIATNFRVVEDVGTLYGKAGLDLFMLNYYKVNRPANDGKIAYKILDQVNREFSQNVKKNYIHSAAIASFWSYLNKERLIDIDVSSYFDDVDAFLMECIYDNQISGWRKVGGPGILNYFLLRLPELADNYRRKEEMTVAALILIGKIDFQFSNRIKDTSFWQEERNPSYYEYNPDAYNIFNYLHLLKQYECLAGPFRSLRYLLLSYLNWLDTELFPTDKLNRSSPILSSLVYTLHVLVTYHKADDTSLTDTRVKKIKQLYSNMKKSFEELIRDISTYELLRAIQLIRQLKREAGGNLKKELSRLYTKLDEVIASEAVVNCFASSGIPNLGLVNGVSGVGLCLLNKNKLIDDSWSDFLFLI